MMSSKPAISMTSQHHHRPPLLRLDERVPPSIKIEQHINNAGGGSCSDKNQTLKTNTNTADGTATPSSANKKKENSKRQEHQLVRRYSSLSLSSTTTRPPRERPPPRRCVSFDEGVVQRRYIHLNDMTDDEFVSCYYQHDEYEQIRSECRTISKLMSFDDINTTNNETTSSTTTTTTTTNKTQKQKQKKKNASEVSASASVSENDDDYWYDGTGEDGDILDDDNDGGNEDCNVCFRGLFSTSRRRSVMSARMKSWMAVFVEQEKIWYSKSAPPPPPRAAASNSRSNNTNDTKMIQFDEYGMVNVLSSPSSTSSSPTTTTTEDKEMIIASAYRRVVHDRYNCQTVAHMIGLQDEIDAR